MPFLRFSRDRRGYESTFLLYAARRRGDKDAPALLYWFRTPPHIKIGRAAFDEDTVRALEDQHPEVEFDWTRILAARPPAPEPVEVPRPPRRSGRRPDSRVESEPVRPTPPATPVTPRPAPAVPVPAIVAPPPRELTPVQPTAAAAEAYPAAEPGAEMAPPARRFIRVFDAPPTLEEEKRDEEKGRPEPESRPHPLSDPSAAERAVGSEQLSRLRGQYAAALARIGSRITDPALADTLRTLAERANPDGWVTDTEVRDGLAGLGDVYSELARHIGRRRRRRRRGGRGTAVDGGAEATPESSPESSESPDESDGPSD